jgi:hypothetical protein
MSIKIKVTCVCGEEVAGKDMNEPQTIHHPFKPPEYRYQICGSDADELAHMWKCERCHMVENGVHNHRLDVYKEEKEVQ